jgi:starch synthase
MQVLQVSAEYHPLLKTGGLADVTGALPAALAPWGCEVRALLPGFASVLAGMSEVTSVGHVGLPWGEQVAVVRGCLSDGVVAYAIDAPGLYLRAGGPYESLDKQPFGDNHRRFAALAWVARALANGMDSLWTPQVVHAHDWHAGLVPVCMREVDRHAASAAMPTVFTIHNLAYQGVFDRAAFDELGLPEHTFQAEGLEYFGQMSFMKAGLFYADCLTTVSPTYAQEIQQPEFGCGLHGLLQHRRDVLHGILNGVDTRSWNSSTDPCLSYPFELGDWRARARNKKALQQELGLVAQALTPLFAVVSRLSEQKGLPLVLAAVDHLVANGAQLALLGSGDADLEAAFLAKAEQYPGQVAVRLGYDEPLAHRFFAGSDISLVPSRFEPCGLTQLYAMRYGSVPLVRRVGGLADTVTDADWLSMADGTASGFVFEHLSQTDFVHALNEALCVFRRRADWRQLQRTGMQQPHGWDTAAQAYAHLYTDLYQQRLR